jgi:hypothetical protein
MQKNKLIKVSLFLTLFIVNNIFSQVVNIENKRIYDDTFGFSGSLDATLSAMKTKDLLFNMAFIVSD